MKFASQTRELWVPEYYKGIILVTSGITVTKMTKEKQERTMLFRCQFKFVHR